MNKCAACITNKTSYPLQCPDGLENPNLCVDLATDQLLGKLTTKGFVVVHNAFYAIHTKGSTEAEVRIEIVFNKVYDCSLFEGLGGSFRYYQSAYTPEFLDGKSSNFALNFRRSNQSVLLYNCFYNTEYVNPRVALLGVVNGISLWCDECIKAGEYNDGL